ncbi:major facilitator superfamily domain-containing protein [Coprinopsis sp. MPI-PUGE-AT-0042]|nr:major facilitator superfamily domain-containing protein [Coprinopsis sp. MPI-PUGE-AT-0042]
MPPVTSTNPGESSEQDPLLLGPRRQPQQRRRRTMGWSLAGVFGWKAHPYWLIPVVLIMSMSRGITMAPRIQVYKAIACRSITKESGGMGLAELLLTPGCGEDEVQRRAVKIQASVVTTMSALSAITTGFWSRSGDSTGRKPIFAAFFITALLMELVFVLVMKTDTVFGKYPERFILVGPVIEGLVGGLSVFNGVTHAYISDCTRHGSRSKIFSTVQGMIFVGLAIGPWFSGLFLPKIGYSDSFFFWSIGLIFFNVLYIIFICPESLERSEETEVAQTEEEPGLKPSPVAFARQQMTKFLSTLLLPLFMFTPRQQPGNGKRTWMMVFVGFAILAYLISTGVFSAKYLYAQHVFKWTTAELGYYMSILWITRAFNLLVFLPIVISYFKPKATDPGSRTPGPRDVVAELKFDRTLAQISIGLDGLADALVAITASRSQGIFVALSCLTSFTSGGNPALHSLAAVCIHAIGFSSEVGSLFGAIAVVSAVAHIFSPSIYAATYSKTVRSFRKPFSFWQRLLLFSAVLLLSRVQPDEEEVAHVHAHSRQSTARLSHYDYEAISTTEENAIAG